LINDFKKDQHTYGLKIPGGLIDKGIKSSIFEDKHEDIELLKELEGKIKNLRLLFNTNSKYEFTPILEKFYAHPDKNKIEKLLSVKKSNSINIDIMLYQNKDKIKSLIFILNSPDAKGILSAQMDIAVEEFDKLQFSFNTKTKS
jgi:hypothetical protein